MNRNHVFDSNGPDMRLRGTAQQLFEKYLQLGRDAFGVGDRVTAEGYFQHAEHYFRILNAMSQVQGGQQHHQRRYQSVADGPDGPDGVGDQPEPNGQSNGGAQANGAQANGVQVNGHAPESDADGDAPSAENREPL